MPIILTEEERKVYNEALKEEKGRLDEINKEERKKKIVEMAKKNARPLKEKVKGVVDLLSRIRLKEL